MTYTFKLSRRIAGFRSAVALALLAVLSACSDTESLAPREIEATPTFATSFAGGIPFGMFDVPTEQFGARYNGAMLNIWPDYLLKELAAVKARGGRIVLTMSGSNNYYKDADGHFSLTKWKQRIDRYRGVDFSPYVKDGTIIAHYLIDEPNDPTNWNGQAVPGSTVDEMARYSKQLWPDLPTVARVEPGYFTGTMRYLDAAWAQYLYRRGDASDYIRRTVADAQERGLGLIVGFNILKGGVDNGSPLTASQIESWGSALLASSYPCAFISWKYDAAYLSSPAIGSALDGLREKAQNRNSRSCRGGSSPDPEPPPPPPPSPEPSGAADVLPFGLSLSPLAEYSSSWTGTVYRATPSGIAARLDRAASTGMRLIVALVPSALARDAAGRFSLTRWKAAVDRYRTLPLGTSVSSGALYLHYLVEQPNCASCWGGQAIPWSTVEEMARYSKSIWPGLPTVVRVAPSVLGDADFQWSYLDAGWIQYNTLRGDLRTYIAGEAARARLEGLGLVAGLNLEHASGAESAPMTPNQIRQFGTILAEDPSVCALIGWKYDSGWLDQTGVRAALDSVASVAKGRAAASCTAG
jgi:hypothetical protein